MTTDEQINELVAACEAAVRRLDRLNAGTEELGPDPTVVQLKKAIRNAKTIRSDSSLKTTSFDLCREAVIRSCRALLEECDDFWLVAALGDWSYEEGVRAPGYRKYLDSWQMNGLSAELLAMLAQGINGNLERLLSDEQIISAVGRSPSKGPDLTLTTDGGCVVVHVKMLFDCTLKKYYNSVVSDHSDLKARAARGTRGLLIVFFTQLPLYDYPDGFWYGNLKGSPSRCTVNVGIAKQYAYLRTLLDVPPTWPSIIVPLMHPLVLKSQAVTEADIARRFETVFQPSKAWRFQEAIHLRDAKVGAAIWEL